MYRQLLPTGHAAMTFIGLVALIDVADLITSAEALALVSDPSLFVVDELRALGDRQKQLGMSGLGALALAGVVFIVWFTRAYDTLRVKDSDTGAAVYAFLIPIYNLIKPYRIALEIWRGTTHGQRAPTLVSAWWLTWLAAFALGRWANVSARQAKDVDGVSAALAMDIGAAALSVVAAVLAMVMIRKISAWHDRGYMPQPAAATGEGERMATVFE